jgi:hypothetical protein
MIITISIGTRKTTHEHLTITLGQGGPYHIGSLALLINISVANSPSYKNWIGVIYHIVIQAFLTNLFVANAPLHKDWVRGTLLNW